MTLPKKLIEVALPLEAINVASAREKSIRHGHPSTLHLWWARRPLAACRAVLFASLVDDPSSHPDQFPTDDDQQRERERLFKIIEELVLWENTNNDVVLNKARAEIMRSTGGNPPPVLDPFAGGGSIPLEAQRLGLEAHASDLNPVAVLITKAMIEIPPKFAGQPPINPDARRKPTHSGEWKGAQGLADDVRYYGKWMRDEAERRIGHLYPKVRMNRQESKSDQELTVIAWLWARTVRCPNPACGAQMPLARSFVLSTKKDKQAWIEPVVDRSQEPPTIRFEVHTGNDTPPESTVNRRGARCIACDSPVPFDHVRAEGKAGRMSAQMMAIVGEGQRERVYLPPTLGQEAVAAQAQPNWAPDTDLPEQALGFRVQNYGMTKHRDLFTPRQLTALTTFSDLLQEVREKVGEDLKTSKNFLTASAYADAVVTYLSFAVDRGAESWCTLARWQGTGDFVAGAFARQSLPMLWDYAEVNPFSASTRNFLDAVEWVAEVIDEAPTGTIGCVIQQDATEAINNIGCPMISTDPPYYDNVGYADLSDFFYVWLRHSLSATYPNLFRTLLVPKSTELIATPFRFGGSKNKAREFFEESLRLSFTRMREAAHPDFPLTVYYAFKQAEADIEEDIGMSVLRETDKFASTGWETMLEGLLKAGFTINGTWPVRTERAGRTLSIGTNALASSIVLVCRPRSDNAPIATRREFIAALRRELPDALRKLQQGNIAPVDLAQAAIGPGMAVYSRYSKVVESDGEALRVRTALQLINQALDEVLAEQEGEYDNATRWAIAWFEQYGTTEGPYGVAETLSTAKNTSVSGLVESDMLQAKGGKVKLLSRESLPANWKPETDQRTPVWEMMQHLIRALQVEGESGAAAILAHLGAEGESARALAYRMYTTCERKNWAQEALAYNSLVVAWPSIVEQIAALPGRVNQPQLGI